jgi:hypothetical protein
VRRPLSACQTCSRSAAFQRSRGSPATAPPSQLRPPQIYTAGVKWEGSVRGFPRCPARGQRPMYGGPLHLSMQTERPRGKTRRAAPTAGLRQARGDAHAASPLRAPSRAPRYRRDSGPNRRRGKPLTSAESQRKRKSAWPAVSWTRRLVFRGCGSDTCWLPPAGGRVSMSESERRFPASSALQMFTVRRQTLGMGESAGAAGPRPSRPPGGGRATPSQPRGRDSEALGSVTAAWRTRPSCSARARGLQPAPWSESG